jgi:branched-subunit amino acid aminotransferase/4-amino-4-deoxychorismate lyase
MSVTAAYLNGTWVDAADLVVPVDDPGFLLGATVSERLRTFGGVVFRLTQHLERLAHSLEIIGLDWRAIGGDLPAVVAEVARRGRSGLHEGDDVGIVIFVTPPSDRAAAGGAAYGTLAVYASPLAFGDWAAKYKMGQRLVISQHLQVPTSCWPSELKCRSRMHYYLADQEARRRDPLARALVLDQQGRLAEASTANLLLVRRGMIFSPRADYILPGVSLGFLQELAAAEQIPFEFGELMPGDIAGADEVLLASTSPCVLPVCYCDGQPVAGGHPGPIFERLIEAWGRQVGVDIRRQAERFSARVA